MLPGEQRMQARILALKYDGYAHGTQADLVGLGCLAPVHATHLAPVGDTLPSVHVAQSLALALGCLPPPHGLHRPLLPAKPVGHAPHAVRLSLGVLPAAHLTHVAPSELYLPCLAVTSQLRHTLLSVLGALPLSHLRQASPLADTRPLPQSAQLVFFVFGALPGSQRSHVPLAPASPFSQLTHGSTREAFVPPGSMPQMKPGLYWLGLLHEYVLVGMLHIA